MGFWLSAIRKIVFAVSALVAAGVFAYVWVTFSTPTLREIRLGQIYAFIAVGYLYVALLASPLYAVFPTAPLRILYIKARKAIGVSAFFFGLAHGSIEFFFLLGGFAGLPFLGRSYLIAITLSATALFILSVLALTSLRYFVILLGPYWKRVHRFVYLAGVLIVIHALILGTHFADLTKPIPLISFAAVLFLLVLEVIRFDRYLARKFPASSWHTMVLVFMLGALALGTWFFFTSWGAGSAQYFWIHARHL